MSRPDSVHFRLVGSSLLVVLFAALFAQDSFGQGPPSGLGVNVLNTPLPVTGNIGVSGAVSATQSGTWTVGISGTPQVSATQSGTWNVGISGNPQVRSADQTVLLGSFAGSVPAAVFTEAVQFADTTGAKTVRVLTNCFLGADCADIRVRVYTVVNGRSYLVEDFPMQSFVAATRVYDVIGTNISVQLINNNAAAADNIGVAVYGRAN